MPRTLIAGNWKMHGSPESVQQLLIDIRVAAANHAHFEWLVCPPAIYLPKTQDMLRDTNIHWGGQDVSMHPQGPHTGDIATDMLNDFGCQYVIIGHSERRQHHGETNEQVAAKAKAAIAAGLNPIICVGETLAQREQNMTESVVREQLAVVLALHDNGLALDDVVIAYEPIWAIGTGQQATPEQAQAVHERIRQQLKEKSAALANCRTIYGGSVKPSNAAGLHTMPDIDGFLIGGASLVAEQFIEIGRLCNH